MQKLAVTCVETLARSQSVSDPLRLAAARRIHSVGLAKNTSKAA